VVRRNTNAEQYSIDQETRTGALPDILECTTANSPNIANFRFESGWSGVQIRPPAPLFSISDEVRLAAQWAPIRLPSL
jgi:hypothetical protein